MIFVTNLPEIVAFMQFLLLSVQNSPLGPALLAVQLALFGLLALSRAPFLLQTVVRWWPLMLLQILSLVSSLWSSVPDQSARYAVQYLYTVLSALFLARLLGPRRFLVILTSATFVFCLLSFANGRQGNSFTHSVLIGLSGSKNAMAFEALTMFGAALATLMLDNLSPLVRWIALLSVPLGAFFLITTESSTAIVFGVVTVVALVGFRIAQAMTPGARLGMMLMGLTILAPTALLLPEIQAGADHFLYDTLNKDPTLTGRTELWERADDLIARRPLLGWGYQSIWLSDTRDAIALRRLTKIDDGRAFNFHHQWRQIGVDTGFLGILIFAATAIAGALAGLRQFLLRPTIETSFFFLTFLLLLARSYVECVAGVLSIHAVIFYASAMFAFAPVLQAQRQAGAATAPMGGAQPSMA
jgi:exopolysaccharide production protein ExoQ